MLGISLPEPKKFLKVVDGSDINCPLASQYGAKPVMQFEMTEHKSC